MSTTPSLPFTHTPNPAPAPAQRRAAILAEPGFGRYFTDHMVTVRWTVDQGWHDASVRPYGPLTLDPAAMVLHYGQEIFEGLKAYRQPDGSVASFRAEVNASRFRASAARLALPQLPEDLFLRSLEELVGVDQEWVPAAGGEDSLYLRPFIIATEVGLGVRAATECLYLLIASPAGPYFTGGVKPVDVWLATDYTRASPGGTGGAKCGGNYAASLLPQQQAAENGCPQVAYLDATERRWIEEMGSNNLFFVFGSGDNAEVV
ncbi:MAG TPA: branched-chain amino acid aminotransferase, partial [Pseudonocardia sp.]